MATISVITPSIRPKGLKLVKKALDRQTFRDFEWLVNDKRYEGGFWGLNRAYNALVRQAKGRLLVSWQDFTFAKQDALEKFWECFKHNPLVIVSGVGNKYVDENWVAKVWQDPRERGDQGSYYSCNFCDIEFNFCAIPKEAVYVVGGFDEQLDFLGFGMDGYSVCNRLAELGGWDFKLDQTNKSYSLPHERPEGWDKHNLLSGGYEARRQELIDKDQWPVLKYLVKDVKPSQAKVRHS